MKNATQAALTAAALLLAGCVRDNGRAEYGPITDAEYQEADINERALAR